MKLNANKIPPDFIKLTPKGFRLINRNKKKFLLIDTLFCSNNHNLIVNTVKIHNEPSIKLNVTINGQSGLFFIDSFWGSHTKLYSFIPDNISEKDTYVNAFCPECNIQMTKPYKCLQKNCSSKKSILLLLPGGKNKIHVCAKLGCPGHKLEINEMAPKLIESVSNINFFGVGSDEIFGGI